MNYDGSDMKRGYALLFVIGCAMLLVAFTVGVICGSVFG